MQRMVIINRRIGAQPTHTPTRGIAYGGQGVEFSIECGVSHPQLLQFAVTDIVTEGRVFPDSWFHLKRQLSLLVQQRVGAVQGSRFKVHDLDYCSYFPSLKWSMVYR